MAFELQGWSRISSSANTRSVTDWGYKTQAAADTMATIEASGYFDNQANILNVNDTITVVASDSEKKLKVTAVSPNVTVGPFTANNQTHVVVDAANLTTVGGAATEAFARPLLLATDIVNVTLHVEGAVPVTVVLGSAGAASLTVEFSADPAADHQFYYTAVRAV